MKKFFYRYTALLIVLFLCLSLNPSALATEEEAAVLAFPQADGFGKHTKGGRGGRVIEVTTLKDGDGIEGSLRQAVEAEGPRTIIFKVAGNIELVKPLKITNPYITIAGQTAPSDGICLKNHSLSIRADEVIIRNIRVRLGAVAEQDAMGVTRCKNLVIDHCSVSWGVDETLSVTDCDRVSVQWCFITEGLHDSIHHGGKHSKGSLVNGSQGQSVSFHHNLFAHNDARNPRPQGRLPFDQDPVGFYFDFTNNVVYDWGRKYAAKYFDTDCKATINFINNYFLAGPSSEADNIFIDKGKHSYLYFSGNFVNGKMPADQYSKITYEDFKKPNYNWKLPQPFDNQTDNIQPAELAYAMVMKNAGAALVRDSYDKRIVDEVLQCKGRVIDSPSDVGGWPILETGPAYLDSDNDGMPDDWELAHGLDPNDPTDGSLDRDGDGYTNVEEYLNSLMDHLYTEDVDYPEFDHSFRFFRHLRYLLLRLYLDIRRWFRLTFS